MREFACCVRRGGSWKQAHGSTNEALPGGNGEQWIGRSYGVLRRLPDPIDEAGTGNQLTVRLVRHSQRKRRATDRPNLRGMAPVLDPTICPFATTPAGELTENQTSHALSFGPVRQSSGFLQCRKECWCQTGPKKHSFGSEVVV